MSALQLSAQELDALRLSEPRLVILDVRLAEDHACRSIAGSVNNCVYEMAFHERLPALLSNKETPVCVYGESGSSHEAAMAAEKLTRAGYTKVYRLTDCLAGWCEAGLPEQGNGIKQDAMPLFTGRLAIDLAESRVEWLGRNLLNKHWGRLPLKRGWLELADGKILGGEFILNMAGITCDDLAGNPYHDVLIAHLRSDDFFDTALFPEAALTITRAAYKKDMAPGSQNLEVEALLTMKGVTEAIQFTASSGLDGEGRYAAQAAFSIDRTRWGVLYGSGSFFHRLAGHLVKDLIEVQLRIVMKPN
ncbi:MAG: YceI family protein [Prosthecobacter sp.]|nr:YceI family protein [Prosthecobacter sp.]